MLNILLKVIKAIGMTVMTICILPFILIGMLLLSIVRLGICIAVLLKPRIHIPQLLKVPVNS